jgi:polyhydroxybutyrate depolymerase
MSKLSLPRPLLGLLIIFTSAGLTWERVSPLPGISALAQSVVAPTRTPSQPPKGPPIMPGDYKQMITADGVDRQYLLHVPTGYDGSQALPVVFILHGQGGAAGGMVKATQMNDKADKEGFFAVYPNGTGDPRTWNNNLMPEQGMTVDDVAFFHALILELETKVNVDNNRVYAAGFSAGAGMANRLGAELSGDLAAIAVVEGTIGFRQPDGSYAKTPDPIRPIAVVIFHGKKDQLLPYDGGQGANNYTTSVADAVKFWTTADNCKGNPEKETLADGNTVTNYSQCDSDTEVVLYTILNGGHEWPTLDGHATLSATDAIWDFFSQHPRVIKE